MMMALCAFMLALGYSKCFLNVEGRRAVTASKVKSVEWKCLFSLAGGRMGIYVV